MPQSAKLAGVELYFNDLEAATNFYQDVLGLSLDEEDPHHHAKFDLGSVFLCLEAKGRTTRPWTKPLYSWKSRTSEQQ